MPYWNPILEKMAQKSSEVTTATSSSENREQKHKFVPGMGEKMPQLSSDFTSYTVEDTWCPNVQS